MSTRPRAYYSDEESPRTVDLQDEARERFKVEVIADNSGKWCGNALTFETRDEAEEYARDLARRWVLVREWRVVPVEVKP